MSEEYKALAEVIRKSRQKEDELLPQKEINAEEMRSLIKESYFRKQVFEFFILAMDVKGNRYYSTKEVSQSLKISVRKLYNAITDFVYYGLLVPLKSGDRREKSYKIVNDSLWVEIGRRVYGDEK